MTPANEKDQRPEGVNKRRLVVSLLALPASLIFGALYQVYGALAAFGWGAGLALIAVVILVAVRGRAKAPPL